MAKPVLHQWGDEMLTVPEITARVPYNDTFVRRAIKACGAKCLDDLTRHEAVLRARTKAGCRKSTRYLENQIVYSNGPLAVLAVRRQRKWCVSKDGQKKGVAS